MTTTPSDASKSNSLESSTSTEGKCCKSYAAFSENSEKLIGLLNEKFQGSIAASIERSDVVGRVDRKEILQVMQTLKSDPELSFSMLVDLTAIDWMDKRSERFEVVYQLMSLKHRFRLRLRVVVPETDAKIASMVPLWASANFLERECWDMYGIVFDGHPDLRRLLMYDEFEGHPLRKDYPVQKKQPRVKLRAPEVQNTAVAMVRPELVQIGRGKKTEVGGVGGSK